MQFIRSASQFLLVALVIVQLASWTVAIPVKANTNEKSASLETRGVVSGIIIGALGSKLYNKYKDDDELKEKLEKALKDDKKVSPKAESNSKALNSPTEPTENNIDPSEAASKAI